MLIAPANDAKQAESSDGLPTPRRYWAVSAIVLAVIMAMLDSTILNVALPAIAQTLEIRPTAAVWVINTYLLTVTVLLLPLASLSEIVGYRRVYLWGVLLFVVASVACANADSLEALLASRILQGIGAAGIMCVNLALIRFIYPRNALGKGIGLLAVVVAASTALGPTAAGVILAFWSWPWLFIVNVPIGCVALLIAIRALPHIPRQSHRFDVVSAMLNVLTFGFLIIAVSSIGHSGRTDVSLLAMLMAVLFGYVLVRRQLPRAAPLFPVDLLGIPVFASSIATSICAFIAQMLAFVFLPFYLHELGKGQLETGLIMTPWPLTVLVTAPLAGRLADRYPVGLLVTFGLLVLSAGLAGLALLPDAPDNLDIGWRMAACGLGFGLFQAPNNRAIMDVTPRSRSGSASGAISTARLLGQALGTALVVVSFGQNAQLGGLSILFLAAGFSMLGLLISYLR
ncbi:MFS transporter [Stutzerimonas tarimensis]|uniref:MFS transporter n=1 Tax=Stutzerimonas tarimensis TaxID=1507735 RepID=A0ABV7T2P4_9GAMM